MFGRKINLELVKATQNPQSTSCYSPSKGTTSWYHTMRSKPPNNTSDVSQTSLANTLVNQKTDFGITKETANNPSTRILKAPVVTLPPKAPHHSIIQ